MLLQNRSQTSGRGDGTVVAPCFRATWRTGVGVYQNGSDAGTSSVAQTGKRLGKLELMAFAAVALTAVTAWGVFLVWLLLKVSGLA
jgi:hypothetical protein